MKNLMLITAAVTLMSGAAMAQTVMAGSPQDPAVAMSPKVKSGASTLVATYPGYIWTAASVSPTYSWGPVAPVTTPMNTMPPPKPTH
jgi:hypothetical protein